MITEKRISPFPFSETAADYFFKGYNCAQSVYAAFAPALGIDAKEALRRAAPFGGGFGRMREVCGAFSGMMLVMGDLFGYDDPLASEQKKLYPRVQVLGARFRERFGDLVCRELLQRKAPEGGTATERTAEFYQGRPCARLVRGATEILEEYLTEEGVIR